MKQRRLRFTITAQLHVVREKAWWLANREHVEVFADELEHAPRIVGTFAGAGTLYARSPVAGVRRVYLRRVCLHLYYTFDEEEVIIRALGGPIENAGPRLDR